MTKSMIAVLAITSILLSAALMSQEVYGPPPATPEKISAGPIKSDHAIPDWVDQNFRWYGEGLIEQSELVNAIKFLIENNIMILEPTEHTEDNAPIESGKIIETTSEGYGTCPTEETCFQVQVTSYVEAQEVASKKIKELLDKGDTTSQDWQEVIDQLAATPGVNTTDSVADYLQAVVVLCSTAIDKEIFALQSEISLLEELSDMHTDVTDRTTDYSGSSDQSNLYDIQQWITKKTSSIDSKIQSLQTGIKVLEETLASTGDDAQLANIDLQNSLQKQQQTLQTMSNVSKMLHDTGMAIIRKIG